MSEKVTKYTSKPSKASGINIFKKQATISGFKRLGTVMKSYRKQATMGSNKRKNKQKMQQQLDRRPT